MAQELTMKSKPLGKDEVLFLLNLINNNKAITTKATNATNNKLKEDAWKTIAREFSGMAGEMRRPEQLRLKWENLKKTARKRSAIIRHNNFKAGGGKTYIPSNEILDRVTSMLVNKHQNLAEEIKLAQRDKDLAMAAYFRAKARKIELESAKLKCELEILKSK